VLAWELFNEVHWVDAYRIQHNEAAVAAWHDEMAAYVRSIDVYHHLVTTSTDNIASPIYRSMDYYQPHLYTTTMLAAVRRFNLAPEREDRPIFYGEVGNDHMRVTDEQKAAAVEHVPLAWASIMGEGQLPAQIWEGDKLFARERLAELGAVARFLRATKLAERDGLKPFTARVDSSDVIPLAVSGGETWRKRDLLHLAVAMDGRQPAEYGIIPRYLVAEANHRKEGFPDCVQFEVELPRATSGELRIAGAGPKGAGVSAIVDGNVVGTRTWKALPKSKKEDGDRASADRAATLPLSIAPGKHTIEIRNTGGKDWIDFDKIEFDVPAPILAAAGKRDENFIALWLWNQRGVFAAQTPRTVSGTLIIDDVPGGQWKVTWWNTETGTETDSSVIEHRGGPLQLKSPQISRHAAVVLTR
jgi:hypothetical protein